MSLKFIHNEILPLLLKYNYLLETTATEHLANHLDYYLITVKLDISLENAQVFVRNIDKRFLSLQNGINKFFDKEVDLLMSRWAYQYIYDIVSTFQYKSKILYEDVKYLHISNDIHSRSFSRISDIQEVILY